MKAINLETNDTVYLLSIDKNSIDKEILVELVERIRLECLIKKADFGEDIEDLGEEIKAESKKDEFAELKIVLE